VFSRMQEVTSVVPLHSSALQRAEICLTLYMTSVSFWRKDIDHEMIRQL
jgi:hypothetical protein